MADETIFGMRVRVVDDLAENVVFGLVGHRSAAALLDDGRIVGGGENLLRGNLMVGDGRCVRFRVV